MADKEVTVIRKSKMAALSAVSEQFKTRETVLLLQKLMSEVTKKEITADTVNAACNCVEKMNSTIKTTIHAAGFLAETATEDD